jgi:uncharacterized spore protein YtfJ
MLNISELMDDISSTLVDTANSEVVVGQPIELGNATIVPLSRVSIGFGGAGGEGDQKFGCRNGHRGGKGKGSGAGGAAKVRPVGVIVFTEDGVAVEKIPDRLSPIEKIFEKVPDFIDRVHKHR